MHSQRAGPPSNADLISLPKGRTRWHRRVSNPGPLDPESYALLAGKRTRAILDYENCGFGIALMAEEMERYRGGAIRIIRKRVSASYSAYSIIRYAIKRSRLYKRPPCNANSIQPMKRQVTTASGVGQVPATVCSHKKGGAEYGRMIGWIV